MLISHQHKFIIIRSTKTASTSTLAYFQQFCIPESMIVKPVLEFIPEIVSDVGVVGPRGVGNIENSKWRPHIPAQELRSLLTSENLNMEPPLENIWDNYFKFCNIRNPYDKATSMYFDRKFRNNIPILDLDSERVEFENWLEINYYPDSFRYTENNEFSLDDTIRYENLQEDMARICNRLNVEWNPVDFPTFKTGRRPANITSKDLYTELAKSYIENRCAVELSIFNYEFPA